MILGGVNSWIDLKGSASLSSSIFPTPPVDHYGGYYRKGNVICYLDDAGKEHYLSEYNSSRIIHFKEDFESSLISGHVLQLNLSVANGGTNSISTFDSNLGQARLGIHSCNVATNANSRAAGIINIPLIRFSNGFTRLTTYAKLSALATVADNFVILLGFIDNNLSASITDGVFFKYDFSNANIISVTSNNSVQTTSNTGIAMTTNWNRYDIEVNELGTEAKFYINKILVSTITTNIPVNAGRETSIGFGTHRITSGTAKSLLVDSIEFFMCSRVDR